MSETIQNYRDLKVWQKSIVLIKDIYALCSNFPDYEKYGLCSQMRRSAVSVAANIAEGHASNTTRRYIHHLGIAYASLRELETHIVIAHELTFCPKTHHDELLKQCSEIGKMMNSLTQALEKRISPAPYSQPPIPSEALCT